MKHLSQREYAELIDKVLDFLKEHKISQNSISERINYYSLSKIKNSKKYPQKIIEGKNRYEIFTEILDVYGLKYDYEEDLFTGVGGEFKVSTIKDNAIYYVLYYFSFAKQFVGKGLVTITDKKWVTLEFNDPNHTFAFWRGTFEVVESYTFLYLEKKGNTTPVKALYSFFSGTIKHGRPVLIGTYSTIKRDGSPTAGNVVMEKVSTKDFGSKKILDDTDPRVTAFLLNKNFTLETITPPTISDLPKLLLNNLFVGNFIFYWPYKNGRILNGKMTIKETAEIIATFENLIFKGTVKLNDHNTLYLKLKNSRINRNLKSNNVHAYLNINNYNAKDGVIAGILITPSLLVTPSSFPILIIKKGKELSQELIKVYFESFSAPLFSAIEPLELSSIFTNNKI